LSDVGALLKTPDVNKQYRWRWKPEFWVTIMVISVCFSWALDPHIINFKFCLAALSEL